MQHRITPVPHRAASLFWNSRLGVWDGTPSAAARKPAKHSTCRPLRAASASLPLIRAQKRHASPHFDRLAAR